MTHRRMKTRMLAACALVAAGWSAPAAAAESIRFAPAEGSTVRKVWTTTHDLRSEAIVTAVGERQITGATQVLLVGTEQLEVIDEYRRVAGGRPLELRRSYLTIEHGATMAPAGDLRATPRAIVRRGPIEGTSVVFTWVDEEQGYGRYFDALEGREPQLPGLAEDLDLRVLLPQGDVEPGSRWNVDLFALRDVLGPGGNLHFREPDAADPMLLRTINAGVGSSLFGYLSDSVTGGAATVDFVGVEERDGVRVAVLKLDVEFRALRDRTQFARQNASKEERVAGVEQLGVQIGLELRGTGEVLWNLDENRAEGLSFTAQQAVAMQIRFQVPGEDVEREQEMRLTGEFRLALDVEPTEAPPVPGPK